MTARLSEAEARSLGLVAKKPSRGTRKAITGVPYHSRCCACPAEFDTVAAEERHVTETHHARYETL